ncbi:MAG: hypothetical protein CMI60_05935 [Parvibaculum sp.]|jgi:hypothetical protein|nr:hypothetical protein [Parvibaculum sp.]|tara:strand:+ start:3638 stop:4267 length:630 start_codon:yes stop_codon:yes gene_type:complete
MDLSRLLLGWPSAARVALFGLFVLSLAACFPTSEHPIALNGEARVPDIFSGIWNGGLGDGKATLIFMEGTENAAPSPRFAALIIRHREGKPSINEGWLEFEAEAAEIRGEIFLSALLKRLDGKPAEADEAGYYLFRVQMTGDEMTVTTLDDRVMVELLNRGALDGTVSHSVGLQVIRITSDSIGLRAFLVNADLDEVFSEPFARFTRQR